MLITALQKNTRQTPRKVRLVANAVKKLPLEQAIKQLAVVEKRASLVIMKVLRQALANAWHNHGLKLGDLKLKSILVEVGPTYKRFNAVSRGRAHGIFKRSCHIRVILESKEAKPKVQAKQAEPVIKAKKKTKEEAIEETKAVKPTVESKIPAAQDMKKVAVDKGAKGKSHITRTKSFGGRS